MLTPTIRPFRNSDVSWIVDEHAIAYTKILGLTDEEVEQQSQNLRRFFSAQSTASEVGILPAGSRSNSSDFPVRMKTWVATDTNDEPVGCVSIRISAIPDFDDESKVEEWVLKITNLLVGNEYRKQGIATALLREAEAPHAPDGSEPTIRLEAHDESTDARRLYTSLGYTWDGTADMNGRLVHFFKKEMKDTVEE